MDRSAFIAFCKARGWTPGTPLTPAQRTALRTAIKNRLDQPDAPRGRIVDQSRDMTADEAADALLEELS